MNVFKHKLVQQSQDSSQQDNFLEALADALKEL